MNLAGVERVFELEDKLARLQRKVDTMERRSEALREEIAAREEEISRLEEVRQSVRAEIVRYEAPGTAIIPVRHVRRGR
jgi:MerR family transcriptional regulator/heat shock protein HspR